MRYNIWAGLEAPAQGVRATLNRYQGRRNGGVVALTVLRQKSTVGYTVVFSILMIVLIVFVYTFNVPNPNMILIAALVLSTSIGGTVPGAICAALMLAYSLFFFSTDHSFVRFTDVNLHKMIVITLGVLINYFSVALLKKNRDRAESQLKRVNDEMIRTNARLEQTNDELEKVNNQLKAMATRDSLTNLRNRYALRQDFELYVGIPLYVGFLDLDDFKTLNDSRGHAFGDRMLMAVGKALTDSFRTSNCYRYGGDEFLIIAENETEEGFKQSCDSAKRQLEAADIRFSGGCVYGVPESIPQLRSMIMQADEMLYRAKQNGKDQFAGSAFDRAYVPRQESAARHRSHHEKRD